MLVLLILTAVAYCLAGFGLKIGNPEGKVLIFGADSVLRAPSPTAATMAVVGAQ